MLENSIKKQSEKLLPNRKTADSTEEDEVNFTSNKGTIYILQSKKNVYL